MQILWPSLSLQIRKKLHVCTWQRWAETTLWGATSRCDSKNSSSKYGRSLKRRCIYASAKVHIDTSGRPHSPSVSYRDQQTTIDYNFWVSIERYGYATVTHGLKRYLFLVSKELFKSNKWFQRSCNVKLNAFYADVNESSSYVVVNRPESTCSVAGDVSVNGDANN